MSNRPYSLLVVQLQSIKKYMNLQPYSQQSFPNSYTPFIQQKVSNLNNNPPSKNYILELPRFFSEQKKNPKRKILSNKYETEVKNVNLQKEKGGKKMSKLSLKCSKTQKNETPTKVKFNGKSIKIEKEKLKELISKGKVMQGIKQKLGRRQSLVTEMDYVKPPIPNQKISIAEDNPATHSNTNKIKYKSGSQEKTLLRGKKIINFIQTEEAYSEPNEIKTSRETKLVTEQSALVRSKETISKVQIKNKHLFGQFIQKFQENNLTKGHQRIFSLINKPTIKSDKIEKQHIQHLHFLEQVYRKTIIQPNNLDFPQAYIVTDKSKLQKTICNCLDQKYRKPYRKYIIFCSECEDFAGYFQQIAGNSYFVDEGTFGETQVLGVQSQKNREKYYSQAKMAHNQAQIKNQNQQSLAIQNKNKNLGKNNELIKSLLEGIINKKNFPYYQLFQSLLASSSEIETFEFITFLDKTLKWQILKMPTYPFLPACQTNHQHYLILDLDQTLIHFDPQNDMFHIRPYAEDFLKKMAPYFEITIFTAATKEYADEIINEIDKEGNVKHRLYRNHLTFVGSEPLKDISLLGRNIKSTIIIDNLHQNFRLQMENGIQIKPWLGKGQDRVLQKVQLLLLKIVNQFPDDLRKGLKLYKGFIEKQIAQKFNHKSKIQFKI